MSSARVTRFKSEKKWEKKLNLFPLQEFVQPSGRILQSRAESQRIAAWELLYRVRHPGQYVSRLQTILRFDITINDPRLGDDQHNANYRYEGSWFPTPYESG